MEETIPLHSAVTRRTNTSMAMINSKVYLYLRPIITAIQNKINCIPYVILRKYACDYRLVLSYDVDYILPDSCYHLSRIHPSIEIDVPII